MSEEINISHAASLMGKKSAAKMMRLDPDRMKKMSVKGVEARKKKEREGLKNRI